MAIATVVGTFVAFCVILHLLYQHGAASATLGPPNVPHDLRQRAVEPNGRVGQVAVPLRTRTRLIAIVVGFAIDDRAELAAG